jgi:hypothetical protein
VADEYGGGDWFSGFLGSPWTKAGSAGLGFGSDLYSFIQNLQRQQNMQKIYDILGNPQKLAGYADSLMPQYSPAAKQLFNSGVNANWASTTGGAPGGAATANTANAWAGLASQNWQAALQQAISALTGGGGVAHALPQNPLGATGGILKSLAALSQLRGQGQTGLAPSYTAPQGPQTDPSTQGFMSGVE